MINSRQHLATWVAGTALASLLALLAGCVSGACPDGDAVSKTAVPDWSTGFGFYKHAINYDGRFNSIWLASMQPMLDVPYPLPALSQEQVLQLLQRPIPRPEDVAPETTLVQVIEQVSGKRFYWIPFDLEYGAHRVLTTVTYRRYAAPLWTEEGDPTFGDLLLSTLDTLVFEHGLWPRCKEVGDPRFRAYLAFMKETIQLVPLAIRECGDTDEDVGLLEWSSPDDSEDAGSDSP